MPTNTKEYQQKYARDNLRVCSINLNLKTDADIITKLESVKAEGESIQGYIKRLIRDNIKYGDY